MTPNDVARKRVVWKRVDMLAKTIQLLQENPAAASEPRLLPMLGAIFVEQLAICRRIVLAPIQLNQKLSKIRRKGASIDSFTDEEVNSMFRFDNRAQLRRVLAAFQFPPLFRLR